MEKAFRESVKDIVIKMSRISDILRRGGLFCVGMKNRKRVNGQNCLLSLDVCNKDIFECNFNKYGNMFILFLP